MAFDLNKQELIGKLGKDVVIRETTNGTKVASFSVATTHSYKGKDGNWVNDTTWHNCVGYNLADFFTNSLVKGAKFYVEGRTQHRTYDDKEGNKRYITEVIVNTLIPLADNRDGNFAPVSQQPVEQPVGAGLPEGDDLPF